ncbi:MAG: DNA replication/repair protein RecF [Anaerovoracaceae bacterium]|jgi:DNA replication and repair protein RecF
MYFTEISLKNFRNYREQTVSFHPNVNIIAGNNAQGKTNLLESLYIMSLGKSFRTNKDAEMIGFGGDFSCVKSIYMKEGRERSIEIILSKEGKSIQIDGCRARKSSDLLENAYIVSFTPEDMKIVKDEPEKRRRFIDRELCQLKPVYFNTLGRYKKVLMQRNSLLKEESLNDELMEIWENSLAEYGSRIIIARMHFVENLKRISRELHSSITDGKEDLDLFYESSIPFNEKKEEIQKAFLERLQKERKKDLYRGSTGSGPHRDDLKITIDGKDVRNYGSQGQQRTAALSLKLAEVRIIQEEKKENPVLLLDDVLSELDEKRQKFLLKSLSEVQLFITAAEMKGSLWNSLPERKVFIVENGNVTIDPQVVG